MLRNILAVALLALAACAGAQAGDTCTDERSGLCESNTVGLFCDDGRLKAVECRGTAGCNQGSGGVTCDTSKARAGDACQKEQESMAQCDAGNQNQGLVCKQGTWTAVACTGCAVQGGQVVCAQ